MARSTPSASLFILFWAIVCAVAQAQNTVFGVYFVQQGTTPTMQQQQAIITQLLLIQQEFLSNFGRTFEIANPPVRMVKGDHDSDWYVNTLPAESPDVEPRWYRLRNMKAEVASKLALDETTRVVNYPNTMVDGNAGASTGGAGQGSYMDFDDLTCVYGGGESAPYPDRSESVCGAHELHELGHNFGLSHTGPTEDCMRFGFYKSSAPANGFCQFSPENRETVLRTNSDWLPRTTVQQPPCILTDSCDPTVMFSGFRGTTVTDLCNVTFRIGADCSLTRV